MSHINNSWNLKHKILHSGSMCGLRNIAMRDYQESMTTGHTDTRTDGQTDAGQSDPYVLLCFAGDTKIKDFINAQIHMMEFAMEVTTQPINLHLAWKIEPGPSN